MERNYLKFKQKNQSFHKHRRIKSFVFLISSIILGLLPHVLRSKYSQPVIYIAALMVVIYGLILISKNLRRNIDSNNILPENKSDSQPVVDILVAARDEQNVVNRLIEMLFNLDFPSEKLNIYIIDDGSVDNTNSILKKLSKKYEKLNIITRKKDAGGGKSGALNYALKYTKGEWIFILDADAQLKRDTLKRLINFALNESWYAVQLRKSVINTNKNFLTSSQSIEMVMDAIFQYGRLKFAGVSELRGNGQLIRKDVLLNCGSFNEDTVTDDLDLSFRLLISSAKIGILWDPPVMEEAVENLSGLFAQRQRWAEGGLQRFFDYGGKLIFGSLKFYQKFDLTYFFILQYGLPIISIADFISSLFYKNLPFYWPLSLSAFTLSIIASCYGSSIRNEGPTLPKANLFRAISFIFYMSHWFVIIPWVTLKMSLLPKKILWKKTLHKG